MNNVDFPPAPRPSREPVPDVDVNHNPEIPMPEEKAFAPLSAAEKRELCTLITRAQSTGEDLSDLILDGLASRVSKIVKNSLPWWLRWFPIPVQRLRDKLDEYFPEIILDPLRDALGCPTSGSLD